MTIVGRGNVRELENEIERLVVLVGEDRSIAPDLLSPRILHSEVGAALPGRLGLAPSVGIEKGINMNGTLRAALSELEAIMIKQGLERCGFNKSKLSRELGISRASLIMKVEKYGLDKRKKAVNE